MPHVTFVTGTRAEFGLMLPTLHAIRSHPKLRLSLLATGMHLDPTHGKSIEEIRRHFKVDATVPWPRARDAGPGAVAIATGAAIVHIARALDKLRTDVVLVVGDRVEAFAGATAAHLSHRLLAHVHGGDRAQGQLDDSLRHAITKLAHIHFPATQDSARRILRLGEDRRSVHLVGSPGLDQIKSLAAGTSELQRKYGVRRWEFVLLVLHPAGADEAVEYDRARAVLAATAGVFPRVLVVYPNNDPGSKGILRAWQSHASIPQSGVTFHPDLPRSDFLGLMRDASVLVGNSSSGIIEAASFGTPVLDIGPRQLGRLTSGNVVHCDYKESAIRRHLRRDRGRFGGRNVYGDGRAGVRIAKILAAVEPRTASRFKLISY